MRFNGYGLLISLQCAALAACASPRPAAPLDTGGGGAPASSSSSRTLVVAVRSEPAVLSTKLRVGLTLAATKRLFNAHLTLEDENEVVYPYLVEGLPQLGTDSWRVFPDGRMETIYKLRPGLTWHDGTPLSAEDFVLAWRVYTNPGPLPIRTATPQSEMEEVSAPDARTVLIRWRRSYPDAARLGVDFPALPRHLVADAFQQAQADPEALANHRYWNTEFIGLGPYRLDRWEPGAFIEGVAFDGHALGRAQIERIKVLFIEDVNAVVASLLSGAVHAFGDNRAMRFEQGQTLKRQWAGPTAGHVLMLPTGGRIAKIQFRPELVSPRAILDARVRKAILHAVDRQGLSDGLMEGQAVVMHTPIRQTAPYFAQVDRAITKYPYDLARAEQLMRDAGFARASDGVYTSPTEGRFAFEVWSLGGGHDEQVLTTTADGWRRAGMEAVQHTKTTAQMVGEANIQWPALNISSGADSDDENVFGRLLTERQIPRAETRWVGTNSGGYSHPELERLVHVYEGTLDAGERGRLMVETARFVSEQVPILPMLYDFDMSAWVVGLQGPRAVAHKENWNIHEWLWK